MAAISFTETESRYSHNEFKCIGVMYGIENLDCYHLGKHIIVVTDHPCLEQIFQKNKAKGLARLQGLLLSCLKFDFEVQNKQGKCIAVVSRRSYIQLTGMVMISYRDITFTLLQICPVL